MSSEDQFDLNRFMSAQADVYSKALAELKAGKKRSHWMWYIFPQVCGLGSSPKATHYAINGLDEAREYLSHPILGTRLRECAETVLAIDNRAASEIFGYPDDLKFKSSITLFEVVAGQDSIFAAGLVRYFNGERDSRTLELLQVAHL